jgi:hypothetical protein
MNNEFKQQAAKIAASNRPYALVVQYGIGKYCVNNVYSTHRTHQLAGKASEASGYDGFLAVRDSREYV